MNLPALHALVRTTVRDGRTASGQAVELTNAETAAMRMWQQRLTRAGDAASLRPPGGALMWLAQLRGTEAK